LFQSIETVEKLSLKRQEFATIQGDSAVDGHFAWSRGFQTVIASTVVITNSPEEKVSDQANTLGTTPIT